MQQHKPASINFRCAELVTKQEKPSSPVVDASDHSPTFLGSIGGHFKERTRNDLKVSRAESALLTQKTDQELPKL